MNVLLVVVIICLQQLSVAVAAPVKNPTPRPTRSPTRRPSYPPTKAPSTPSVPSSYPLKPGQLFRDDGGVVYAILTNDRFPNTPGYLSVKRYNPIGANLAVCDVKSIRFITPVGGMFIDGEYDFKLSGKTLWAYPWYDPEESIKYTIINGNALTCATVNNPVKSIHVSSDPGLDSGYGIMFKVNDTFLYNYGMNMYQADFKRVNLTNGDLAEMYKANQFGYYNGMYTFNPYLKPIGSYGNNLYFTSTSQGQGSNFTIAFENGMIIRTDVYYPFGGAYPIEPKTVMISSKLYVWINHKKFFSTYDAVSGVRVGTYSPILNTDLSQYSFAALASSADGKTLYILARSNSYDAPYIKFIISCDTSSPTKQCQKTLIGPLNNDGPVLGLAETKSGELVTYFRSYDDDDSFLNLLNYYNIPV